MPSQLAQSHYSYDGEELEHIALLFQLGEHEVQIEAQRCYNVNYIYRRLEKVQFVGRHNKANDDFKCEPGVAGTLDVEECLVGLSLFLFQSPSVAAVSYLGSCVLENGYSHFWMCLQAERQDGYDDKKHGDHGDDLGIEISERLDDNCV